MFDPFAFSGFLQAVKKASNPATKSAKKQGQQQAEEDEAGSDREDEPVADVSAMCIDALQDVAYFLKGFYMKEYQDMLVLLVETCVDVTRSSMLVTRPKGGRGRHAGPSEYAHWWH